MKLLIRAQADWLAAGPTDPPGSGLVPLDAAAESGHSQVAWMLIQQFGIEGCGGDSGVVHVLRVAAKKHQHAVKVMALLTRAGGGIGGVVDTGKPWDHALQFGGEASVKFQLQLGRVTQGKWGFCKYIDARDSINGSLPVIEVFY